MRMKTIKASELVKMLNEAIEKYGDQEVYKTIEEAPEDAEDDTSAIVGFTCIHNDDNEPGKFILCDLEDQQMFTAGYVGE